MIPHDAQVRLLRVPLRQVVFTQLEPRYLDRLAHYHQLLADPERAGMDPGLVAVAPYGERVDPATGAREPLWTPLDGHHRLLAALLAGRADLLAYEVRVPDTAAA